MKFSSNYQPKKRFFLRCQICGWFESRWRLVKDPFLGLHHRGPCPRFQRKLEDFGGLINGWFRKENHPGCNELPWNWIRPTIRKFLYQGLPFTQGFDKMIWDNKNAFWDSRFPLLWFKKCPRSFLKTDMPVKKGNKYCPFLNSSHCFLPSGLRYFDKILRRNGNRLEMNNKCVCYLYFDEIKGLIIWFAPNAVAIMVDMARIWVRMELSISMERISGYIHA